MFTWFSGLAVKVQQAIIVALLVALVVAITAGAWWRIELGDCRLEAARLAGDLAVEKANVLKLEGSIKTQNAAVDAFKAEADKRVEESKKAAAAAQKESARHANTAAAILGAKPADPTDLCKSALDLYRGARK